MNSEQARVKQLFSRVTFEENRQQLTEGPLWGLEINPEARKGGALRYLVLSSFKQQYIIALEGFDRDLRADFSSCLQNNWLITADPQLILSIFETNGLQPLPLIADYQLPAQLLHCGQNYQQTALKIPDGTDELGQICRSAYHYLAIFTKEITALTEQGLEKVFHLECSLLPVLAAISRYGMHFSKNLWEQNKQQAVAPEEADKWATAKGLVDRDLIPNLAADNRLHSHYNPLGAETGRLSSNSPNLQSIPAHDLVRQCFSAPEGMAIISADYSGAELRILAQLSQEPLFLEAFSTGLDFHSFIAQKVFNCEVSKTCHPELRKQAKIINFGLAYGMGPSGLANAAGITVPAANKLMRQYQKSLPTLFNYLQTDAARAIERGYAVTLLGRRRYLDGLGPREAERIARNTPIQGSCADIIKIALVRLHSRLQDAFPKAHIVNTVHDEIVIEVPQKEAAAISTLVEMEMGAAAGALLKDVPMTAEITIGNYWQH